MPLAVLGALCLMVLWLLARDGLSSNAGSPELVDDDPESSVPASEDPGESSETAEGEVGLRPVTSEELTASVVELFGLTADGNIQCSASGTIVAADGAILTTASAISGTDSCAFDEIAVGVTSDASQASELRYKAAEVARDSQRNLALLRLTGPLNADVTWPPPPLVPAPRGLSESVSPGDLVRVAGYPTTLALVGVDVVEQIEAAVLDLETVSSDGLPLLTLSGAIGEGAYGGPVLSSEGWVVGIATAGPAGENAAVPIDEALPILRAADALDPSVGAGPRADLSGVRIWNPRFSVGRPVDRRVEEVQVAPAGIDELCLFVDWEGIPMGVSSDMVWYRDGELLPQQLVSGEAWSNDDNSRDVYLCTDGAGSLSAGTYEVGLLLDDRIQFVEAIELTDEPVEVVSVTWVNGTDTEICGFAINPVASRRHFGLDMLPQGVTILPGDQWAVDLALGEYLVETYDCDGAVVVNDTSGVLVEAGVSQFELGGLEQPTETQE